MIRLGVRSMKILRLAFAAAILSSGLLTGCNVPLGSYPRFWDYAKTKPNDSDLVGNYKVLDVRLPSELAQTAREQASSITLKNDHTAVLTNVPEFDDFGEKLVCRLSGSASWGLNHTINSGGGWSVAFHNYQPSKSPPVCHVGANVWNEDGLGT